MFGMDTVTCLTCSVILFLFNFVEQSYAGECCKAYYDFSLDYHSAQWCDNYCCGTSLIGVLECCDSILLLAPESDRSTLCLDFFAKNIWVPIVGGLGTLGVLCCCCVCCVMCCKQNNRAGTVIVPQQQPQSVVVVPQQQVQPGMAAQQYQPMPSQVAGNQAYQPAGYTPSNTGNQAVYPPTNAENHPTKPPAATTTSVTANS